MGRESELKELESFLKSAADGKGKTVFISGEAGSGKSRLAREFLNLAKQKGVGVMTGWCLSDAAVPYFPFVEAFNAYDASIPVILFYSYIKPVADARTINAMPNAEVKDGLWGVHQDLTHDVSEGRVRADGHGVCV